MGSSLQPTILLLAKGAKLSKEFLSSITSLKGIKVARATTLKAACKVLAQAKPIAVIVTEGFAGLKARELSLLLKTLRPKLPLILYLASSSRSKVIAPFPQGLFRAVLRGEPSPAKWENLIQKLYPLKRKAKPKLKRNDEEWLTLQRAALDILNHDTKNIFTRLLFLLTELPDSQLASEITEHIEELYLCFSEALGFTGFKKRIESLVDIFNSIKLGPERLPLVSFNRIHLNCASRKLLFVEASGLLKNALANILENALKYTPSQTDIHIGVTYQDEEILIDIADHGPGIPDKYKKKVFKRGFRCPTTADKEGDGLGLWLAQNIIRKSGGNIYVFNNPEGGCLFKIKLPAFSLKRSGLCLKDLSNWFKLPLDIIEKKARLVRTILSLEFPQQQRVIDSLAFANLLDHLRLERKQQEQQKYFYKLKELATRNKGAARILLADDSLYIQYQLAQLLVEQGYQVVDYAFNGLEAINLYAVYRPDLIILDITMPYRSGIEVAEELFKKYPKPRIVFLTALAESKVVKESIAQRFKGKEYFLLSKPCRPANLFEVLARSLGHKE